MTSYSYFLTAAIAGNLSLPEVQIAADCAEEYDPEQFEAVMRRWIIMDKDDDLPRLRLAEWWIGNGQRERGEFVKVQCEAEKVRDRLLFSIDPKDAEKYSELRRIEEQLRKCDSFPCWIQDAIRKHMGWSCFRRGFIQEIHCTGENFLKHADRILCREPICQVSLNKWPITVFRNMTNRKGQYSIGGGRLRGLFRRPGGIDMAQVIKAEWPSIKFTWPLD